jgi:CheY-like chemotaxis protein
MAHIVIVDPDTLTAALLAGQLEKAGHSTRHCVTAEQAFAACTDVPPDCLVLELLLPDYNGVALLQLMQSYPTLAAIKSMVVTTVSSSDVGLSRRAWREYGVVDYVSKLHIRTAAIARRIIRIIS